MKLLNQSFKYLSSILLLIVTVWSVVFYFSMLNEIKSSIDEGLENHKRLIIDKADSDSTIVQQDHFDERNYSIREIEKSIALKMKNKYVDTLVYMQDDDDEEMELEPVRMLTTAFENSGIYYELKIINPILEEDDLVKDLFIFVVLLYIVLVISIIVVNNIVLRKLWKPFYDLLEQLQNFRLGKNKTYPKITTQTKEFNDLNDTVNALLKNSDEIFDQQKQFIGNASHELQTPLAIVTSKLELLLEKENLNKEEAENIVEVLGLIERMTKLNKSLLLLAKIENKQFLNNQNISLNNICRQVIEDFEDLVQFKGININYIEHQSLTINIDPALAIIIITNLIKNAIVHTKKAGEIQVELRNNKLIISNSGETELSKEKMFERFNKRSDNASGTGLGLSIVHAICQLYNFNISYQFTSNNHHFVIHF